MVRLCSKRKNETYSRVSAISKILSFAKKYKLISNETISSWWPIYLVKYFLIKSGKSIGENKVNHKHRKWIAFSVI